MEALPLMGNSSRNEVFSIVMFDDPRVLDGLIGLTLGGYTVGIRRGSFGTMSAAKALRMDHTCWSCTCGFWPCLII